MTRSRGSRCGSPNGYSCSMYTCLSGVFHRVRGKHPIQAPHRSVQIRPAMPIRYDMVAHLGESIISAKPAQPR